MGIKYFFKWFRETFRDAISEFSPSDVNTPTLLMLDLNGLIHTSCQKVYKFGAFEPRNLLRKSPPILTCQKFDNIIFEEVFSKINSLVKLINPRELVVCIDGVAPISKQIQQRQRRFVSRKSFGGFDSNCISPGTEFLYKIGIFLKEKFEEFLSSVWLNTSSVYFMDSQVPGEGEHKLFDFLRLNRTRIQTENFEIVIVGIDADLIMMSLLFSTKVKNSISILRESSCEISKIDIKKCEEIFLQKAITKPGFCGDVEVIIYDFVVLSFLIGNDFLPQIPLLNVYDGGFESLLDFYFSSPHFVVEQCEAGTTINFKNLSEFFYFIVKEIYPKTIKLYQDRSFGFKNQILEELKEDENVTKKYLKKYSEKYKISTKLTVSYLKEMEWNFQYYMNGSNSVPWNVYYQSQFAPSARDLFLLLKYDSKSISSLNFDYAQNLRFDPYFQLLCILPPESAHLLPDPLQIILVEEMKEFHPKEIKFDTQGKLNEWEGVPILPDLDYKKIFKLYSDRLGDVKEVERNCVSTCLKMSVV